MPTKKRNRICIRFTDEEFSAVKTMAAENKISVSEFARSRILHHDRAIPKDEFSHAANIDTRNERNVKMRIPFTEDEHAWIKKRSELLGCSMTELIRRSIFLNNDKAPIIIDTTAMDKMYLEVHRQGVNLNQMMTYLNTYKSNADTSGVSEALDKINSILERVDGLYKEIENQIHIAKTHSKEK